MNSTIEDWKQGQQYTQGTVVTHNGVTYQKLDDSDQSEPDAVGGGWQVLENSNVTEYNAIAQSLGSYEQRVIDHQKAVAAAKASAEAKLAALGLTAEELQAIGL